MTGLIKLTIIVLSILLFGKYCILLGGLLSITINSLKSIYNCASK